MNGAIIQVRTKSERLPGKALMPVLQAKGWNMTDCIIHGLSEVNGLDKIIIATTTGKSDDELAEYVRKKYKRDAILFRGDEKDVLKRFYMAAKQEKLNTIIRITGDNPCLDVSLIEKILKKFLKSGRDYISTIRYPLGFNVEILSFNALEKCYKEAKLVRDREHVTSYIYTHPKKFRQKFISAGRKYKSISHLRLTVDSQADYLLMRCIFDYFKNSGAPVGLKDILELYNKKPWLFEINSIAYQKRIFSNTIDELKYAIGILEKLELNTSAKMLQKALNK